MAQLTQITGVGRLLRNLKKRAAQARAASRAEVVVGFTQSYAIHVHENKDEKVHHKVGQAKFLEQPAREQKKEIGRVIKATFQQTGSIEKGLILGGMRLQREAQLLTPVDTGALKASAFTALAADEEQAAQAAYEKSEQIRKKELAKRAKKTKKK